MTEAQVEQAALAIANAGRARHGREEQPWKFFTETEQETCVYYARALAPLFTEAEARGAAAERARIVAWSRTVPAKSLDGTISELGALIGDQWLLMAGAAIERGDTGDEA